MKEIEAGNYSFRAVGIDKHGEMLIINSETYYLKDYVDMRSKQNEFIQFCKTSRHVTDPRITHSVREKESKYNYYDYLGLVDLNSDH